MPSIHILHLSDLHVGVRGIAGGPLESLPEKLRMLRERDGIKFHLVVISGDLADRGSGEYGPVREFITRLCNAMGLDAGHVFLVPGNHDVVRSA